MMMNRLRLLPFLCLLPLLGLSACGDDDDTNNVNPTDAGADANDATDGATDDSCAVVVKESDCDKSLRPMVFVHGTMGSGDNFENVAALFGSNGYCQERIVAIDYDSIGGEDPAANGKIAATVDKVLADTGADKVELIGHSLGTTYSRRYLADAQHAAKVAHYINLSGPGPVANNVPTLSISSHHDLFNTTQHATGDNVTQVTFDQEDHIAIAFSNKAFIEIYKYLRGEAPRYSTVQCGEETVSIEGLAVSLADNTRIAGSAELYELGGTPRQADTLVSKNSADANGHFGPLQIRRNVAYELKGFDETGKLVGYQYFSPFKRSNRLVRLIVPSRNAGFAAGTTDRFGRQPGQVNAVVRTLTGAFRHDLGDSLTIDGSEVLTNENAGLRTNAFTTAAMLMYDANDNQTSDLGVTIADGLFIIGSDVYMSAATPKFIDMNFNGTKLKISNWPASDALVSVVFQ